MKWDERKMIHETKEINKREKRYIKRKEVRKLEINKMEGKVANAKINEE